MNTKIIEIISLLVQKMLQEEDLILNEEKIIQELIDFGYDIDDIDYAFELIFSSTEIIDKESIPSADIDGIDSYNRIFTIAEKVYLPVNLQGLIRRLIILNILNPKETETLIAKTIQNSYVGFAKTRDIWNILEEIVDDENKLDLISQKIPEFNNFFQIDFKYIN